MLLVVVLLVFAAAALGIVAAGLREGLSRDSRPRHREDLMPEDPAMWSPVETDVPVASPPAASATVRNRAEGHSASPAVGKRHRFRAAVWLTLGALAGVPLLAFLAFGLLTNEGDDSTVAAEDLAQSSTGPASPSPTVQVTARPAAPTVLAGLPSGTPTASATPAPANRATLLARAQQDVQARVSVDGVVAFDGTLRANEERSWEGSTRVQISTNRAAQLQVAVNGFTLGTLSVAVGHPDWNTVDWGWAAGWRP
jgi:hypothetical protein